MQLERNQAVDMIRATALFGIAVVNLPFMGLPAAVQMAQPVMAPDLVAVRLVQLLFEAKFFLLFSFIFGWGIEIQTLSATRAGASFGRRFSRRLGMLAILGALHAILVFVGDILVLYAVLGLMAWAARPASVGLLLKLAAALVPIAGLCLMLVVLVFADTPLPPDHPGLGGSFAETVQARWRDWPGTFAFLILFQSHLALAAFFVGMAAARSDFFQAASPMARNLKRATPVLLGLGLLANCAYTFGSNGNSVLALFSMGSLAFAAPLLAAAYLGLILRAADRVRLPEFIVLAGRNSLTSYVLQGVLAGMIFGGYGLGQFGQMGQMALLVLSIGVALVSMALVAAFARKFGQGPLELILRQVTYG